MIKIRNSGLKWLWISFAVIILDRATKWWAVTYLHVQDPVTLLPFFNLTVAYNTGAAFSFLHNASGWQNWFLSSIALGISILVLLWLSRISARASWLAVALTLILGGALGNGWDRLLYGYVIDFLSFHWGNWYFAIFNIADSAICVGAFMIFLHWVREGDK